MLAAGSSMNGPGCSLREMGSSPERRMGHPASVMKHPDRRTGVHERAVEHPAPPMGHPERRSSHPAAFMEHPGRNGAAVWRLRTALLPRNTVPEAGNGIRGRDRRAVGVKRSFIADIGCDGRDRSTDPAPAVSQSSLTGLAVASIGNGESRVPILALSCYYSGKKSCLCGFGFHGFGRLLRNLEVLLS